MLINISFHYYCFKLGAITFLSTNNIPGALRLYRFLHSLPSVAFTDLLMWTWDTSWLLQGKSLMIPGANLTIPMQNLQEARSREQTLTHSIWRTHYSSKNIFTKGKPVINNWCIGMLIEGHRQTGVASWVPLALGWGRAAFSPVAPGQANKEWTPSTDRWPLRCRWAPGPIQCDDWTSTCVFFYKE